MLILPHLYPQASPKVASECLHMPTKKFHAVHGLTHTPRSATRASYFIIQHFGRYQLLFILLGHEGHLPFLPIMEDRRRIMSEGGGSSAVSAED